MELKAAVFGNIHNRIISHLPSSQTIRILRIDRSNAMSDMREVPIVLRMPFDDVDIEGRLVITRSGFFQYDPAFKRYDEAVAGWRDTATSARQYMTVLARLGECGNYTHNHLILGHVCMNHVHSGHPCKSCNPLRNRMYQCQRGCNIVWRRQIDSGKVGEEWS